MERNIKQILGVNKSKQSVNSDLFVEVNFDNSNKLLPPDQINKVLDLGEQFNLERQSCSFYRILGKINPVISNVLFNTTAINNSWEMFNQAIFTTNPLDEDKPVLTLAESIKKHLKEIDGWYGYFDPVLTKASLCNYFDMEPKRERFSFIPDTTNVLGSQIKNWELTITYPYSSDTTHDLINGGILIIDKELSIVGGKNMTAIGVSILHNLVNGDAIRLSGTNLDGEYEVKRIGLDDGNLKGYYFVIDVDFTQISLNANSRITKLYNGVPSQYYFRKFKKIKTRSSNVVEQDDYEIYKLAFSENIFTDDITQFTFNEDIDVSNLTDNLGRPLSELYLTTIKTDSNGIFTNVSSGIESPLISRLNTGDINVFLRNVPVIQKIHTSSGINIPVSSIPLESNVLITNNDFYGDVVEYNATTLLEVVLSDIQHRFNTTNRESTSDFLISGPRPEGYYYKAHQLIKIREFSSYIEEGTITTAGMPEYRVDLGDGRYIWRDQLDIGTIDINNGTLNYPFVNGYNYLYQNYNFILKRQDPFDNWDLYHSAFPADPIGNTMNNNFKINSANNAC